MGAAACGPFTLLVSRPSRVSFPDTKPGTHPALGTWGGGVPIPELLQGTHSHSRAQAMPGLPGAWCMGQPRATHVLLPAKLIPWL